MKSITFMIKVREHTLKYTFRTYTARNPQYGNGTCVCVDVNGVTNKHYIDTRYNNKVLTDFSGWCRDWLADYYGEWLDAVVECID